MRAFAIIIMALLLANCTMYTVEKINLDGTSTIVKIKSTRDLEQPEVHYERGPSHAQFDFKAASVDNNTDVMVGMFGSMMNMMVNLMMRLPPEPLPPEQ